MISRSRGRVYTAKLLAKKTRTYRNDLTRRWATLSAVYEARVLCYVSRNALSKRTLIRARSQLVVN